MEPSPRFDFETELRAWRRVMADTGLTSEVLAELEEHLREDFERQVRAGVGAAVAWEAAQERLGPAPLVRDEFALVGGTKGEIVTLRRHKWKLVLCSAAGVLAAVALQLIRPKMYQSDAKLFFRFLMEDSAPLSPAQVDGAVISMNDQVEILSSRDLAHRVAERIGPAKILRKTGRGDDLEQATEEIRAGLMVSVPVRSHILNLAFRHPDAAVVRPVLLEVIEQFLRAHAAIRDGTAPASEAPRVAVGMITNIIQVQSPSPPWANLAGLIRMQALVVVAGMLGGLGWVWAMARVGNRESARSASGRLI